MSRPDGVAAGAGSEPPLVVVTESLNQVGIQLLSEQCRVVRMDQTPEPERRELLASASAVVTQVYPVDRDLIMSAPWLRVIGKHGVGVDNIDVAAATARGIGVVFTPGANARSVAEHTLALVLSLARRLPALDAAVRGGDFGIRRDLGLTDLYGKTLAVVGAGRTGRLVLDLCCALGMRGIVYDAAPPEPADLPHGCHIARSLDEALSGADVVTVHLPLTPHTRGLIGRRELGLLGTGGYLVNVGRGGVVDEVALAGAVRSGDIAGAAVDVFATEPPEPDNPLLTTPGVILSPHAAGLSRGASETIARQLASDMLHVLAGERPAHAVNPEVYEALRTPPGPDAGAPRRS